MATEVAGTDGVWIDGRTRPGTSGDTVTILNPYDDSVIGRLTTGSANDAKDAIASALTTSKGAMRALATYERAAILREAAADIRRNAEDLIDIVVAEGGKPIRDARREVGRAATLLDLAADNAMVMQGQVIPMDVVPSGVNRVGYAQRVPVGVIAAITPSNSPVNLTMNKVAPALATGNTVVQKPAAQTPFSALWLAESFRRAGLPDGALNVVVGSVADVADTFVSDPRVRMVTITGSVRAGEAVTRRAGVKKLALELGSSAANIVCADADVDGAARSLATSAYLSSGQACISAQRIFVHASIAELFISKFTEYSSAMVIGDPRDPDTEIGPMISQAQVDKVLSWIEDAVRLGARVLSGGIRVQRTIMPTLVTQVNAETELACNEVFAPVATLSVFERIEEAIERANDSVFGLQAGVFTRDLATAHLVGRDLDAGAIWVNDSSRYRQDNYPFGGMKLSGIGREGVQYAMEEMTDWKFLGIKLGPSAGIL